MRNFILLGLAAVIVSGCALREAQLYEKKEAAEKKEMAAKGKTDSTSKS